MWQEIIVGVCVLVALAFMIKRFFAKNTGCSGCRGCGKASECGALKQRP